MKRMFASIALLLCVSVAACEDNEAREVETGEVVEIDENCGAGTGRECR